MKKIIKVTGLDCPNCSAKLEGIIAKSEGIEDVKINFLLEKMIVLCESEEALKKALEEGKKAFPQCEFIA